MTLSVHLFPYLADNYGYLLRDEASGKVACVDAGEADAVLNALKQTGWQLDELWITHWHPDHTDGMDELRQQTGCHVIGPGYKGGRALSFDKTVQGGDQLTFGTQEVHILHTPGHTLDMVNFYLPRAAAVFTGDTLFAMGCGRLFEGTPEQMYQSMEQLRALPPETEVYGGHEYTQANARFALSVDPENSALQARAAQVDKMRAAGLPTMPTAMQAEFETNPFLRYGDARIRAHLGLENASDAAVFAEIRSRKDRF